MSLLYEKMYLVTLIFKKKIQNMGQGMTIKAQVNYGPKNPKAHEVGRVKE